MVYSFLWCPVSSLGSFHPPFDPDQLNSFFSLVSILFLRHSLSGTIARCSLLKFGFFGMLPNFINMTFMYKTGNLTTQISKPCQSDIVLDYTALLLFKDSTALPTYQGISPAPPT